MATKGRTASPISRLEMKPDDLRWQCDPDGLGFETTASKMPSISASWQRSRK